MSTPVRHTPDCSVSWIGLPLPHCIDSRQTNYFYYLLTSSRFKGRKKREEREEQKSDLRMIHPTLTHLAEVESTLIQPNGVSCTTGPSGHDGANVCMLQMYANVNILWFNFFNTRRLFSCAKYGVDVQGMIPSDTTCE